MKPIERDLFTQFRFLSDLQISAERKTLFFAETQTDMENNTYKTRLWSMDTGSHSMKPLSEWAPYLNYTVNERGLFSLERMKDRPGTVIKTLNPANGETCGSFNAALNIAEMKPFGNDAWIAMAQTNTDCPDYHLLTEAQREEYRERKKEDEDYHIVTEYPFVFNARGFINGNRNRLFRINPDHSIQALVSGNMNVGSWDISGMKVVYSGAETEFEQKFTSMVWEYDGESQETRQLYNGSDFSFSKVFYRGEDVIAVASKDDGSGDNPKVYVLKDGVMHLLIDSDTGFRPSLGTDSHYGKLNAMVRDGDDLLFNASDVNEVSLFRLTGAEIRKEYSCGGSVEAAAVGDGCLYAILMQGQKLPELYEIRNGETLQLSDFNGKLFEDTYVAEPVPVILEKKVPVYGWVLEPKDYDPDRKYPAILDIHGGPKTIYGTVYYHEMQYWASKGYFVFFCNPTGSDGRGSAFADLKPAWGRIDYEDIMDFTDEVLKLYPAIDETRLGVTGGSYGGYMTNWIIGHTKRFAAAASQRSISNWISELLVSDISIGFIRSMGLKDIRHADRELWDMSPLKYVNDAVTPTLFIHSTEDYRCPVPEGVQMFTALRMSGVDSKMVLFKGENHELSRSGKPKHRIRRLKEITGWMDHYLCDSRESSEKL